MFCSKTVTVVTLFFPRLIKFQQISCRLLKKNTHAHTHADTGAWLLHIAMDCCRLRAVTCTAQPGDAVIDAVLVYTGAALLYQQWIRFDRSAPRQPVTVLMQSWSLGARCTRRPAGLADSSDPSIAGAADAVCAVGTL